MDPDLADHAAPLRSRSTSFPLSGVRRFLNWSSSRSESQTREREEMEEEAVVSILPSPNARARPPGFHEEIDNKENLYSISEDGEGLPSSSKETPLLSKSRRRGRARGSNLRKSLAWNQAFFTEEGVLNPAELSLLSGTVSNLSGKILSGIDGGGLSPLTRFDPSGAKSRILFHDLEENSCGKLSVKSQSKGAKACEMRFQAEASSVFSRKDHLTGGIPKNLPRSPAPSSQKRVANISTTNPTSKIPRFMPAKNQTSSVPSTTRNVMVTTKGSKSDQMSATASGQQAAALRVHSSDRKKDFGCASSAKSSTLNSSKKMVNEDSHLKLNAGRQFTVGNPTMCPASGRKLSSSTQSIQSASAPVYARPSSLRMPSPTIGFFALGKLSPSYDNNDQRHPQRSDSNVPPFRKAAKLKHTSDLRPERAFTEKKSRIGIAATESIACSSDTAVSASLPSTSIPKTQLAIKANRDRDVVDTSGRNDHVGPESSTFKTDCSERLIRDLLLVGDQVARSSQEQAIEHLSSSKIEEMPGGHSCAARMENGILKEDEEFTIQPQTTNSTENFQNVGPPTNDSTSEIPCQNSSAKISMPVNLQDSNFMQTMECDSAVDILAKHLYVGNARDEASAFRGEHKRSAGDTDSVLDKESASAVKDDECSALPEDGSTCRSRSDLEIGACPQVTGVCVQTIITGNGLLAREFTNIFSEEIQLTVSEERKLHDHQTELNLDGEIRSMSGGAELAYNDKHEDTLKADAMPLMNPLNGKPFSDEWLAALEAFGEEILEMKTGPVQNSPPDKALPEPSPWSPVKKRKGQDIGPFDCTKYSNNSVS